MNITWLLFRLMCTRHIFIVPVLMFHPLMTGGVWRNDWVIFIHIKMRVLKHSIIMFKQIEGEEEIIIMFSSLCLTFGYIVALFSFETSTYCWTTVDIYPGSVCRRPTKFIMRYRDRKWIRWTGEEEYFRNSVVAESLIGLCHWGYSQNSLCI